MYDCTGRKSVTGFVFASLALSASVAAADDRAGVAALHTTYQAAVKNNDAATMDRILADDFVLVTGNGKTYKKADLIAEARTADNHYEHPAGQPAIGAHMGRYRRGHGVALGQGPQQGSSVRLQAVVQRRLRAHARGLAICVRAGVPAPAGQMIFRCAWSTGWQLKM